MKNKTRLAFFAAIFAFTLLTPTKTVSLADWYPDEKLAVTSDSAYGFSALKSEPVGVVDVTDKGVAESFFVKKPATAILKLNDDMQVTSADGEVMFSLSSALDEYLKKDIIPVLNVETPFQAEKLITWFKTEREVTDVAVMSKSAEALALLKAAYPYVRGIIEFSKDADVTEMHKIANKCGANVCVIAESAASVENVRYIQGRFKTVWVRADENSETSIKNSVLSGAYGVITSDFGKFTAVLQSFNGGLTRLPFNVAHRGLPEMYNENSVSGTIAAVNAGATHVELDCYLTTDNEIVFMHDAGLQRTSTGTGNIETYSSEELKKFRLKQFEDEAIPTFADIANALKDTETILILEIKSEKTAIVDVLKTKLVGSGIEDKIVVISFHESQLKKMKEVLPEIPTADLNGKTSDSLKNILKKSGENNSGIDYNFNALDDEKTKGLIIRGFIPWTWTYSNGYNVTVALENGQTGITNNAADSLTEMPLYLNGVSETGEIPTVGGDIKLIVTEYGGKTKEVTGKIVSVNPSGDDEYEVFAEYSPEEYFLSMTLYTQKFTVKVKTETDSEKSESSSGMVSKGCGGSVGSVCGLGSVSVFAAAFVAVIVKGKKND